MKKRHAIDIRIYYEDTDAGGVVYHGSYLRFGERGRTELLRALGHQNSEIAKDFGVMFVVKHIDIDYQKPVFLDDLLKLETRIEHLKNTSFVMHQTFTCTNRGGEMVADMKVALVCVDVDVIKPVRLPDAIRREFEQMG